MNIKKTFFIISFLLLQIISFSQVQFSHSIARLWNDITLEAIRNDFARPTVHARNLFHTSMAMYDAWAVYDERAETVFLGKTLRDFEVPFDSIPIPEDIEAARAEAISYAMCRLLTYRFENAPNADAILATVEIIFRSLGYDIDYTNTDYKEGAAELGNYIASKMIEFGLQDGSNEIDGYANQHYRPWNPPLAPELAGNRLFFNQNRWQPISFDIFIDQSGNPFPGGAPQFLSPEWGQVVPFALSEDNLTTYERNGGQYWVYHDPGEPCYIDTENGGDFSKEYKWGFSLVAKWASHLDPSDSILWDISPASIGNIALEDYPKDIENLRAFYLPEGGDIGTGHSLNPHTGEPYEPQIVPRADYARVLAEFWADGPDSETPPGHWFTILNYVSDHPEFEKKFKGEGRILDDLEWDVKAYLALGGAMHDCAITAWGIKGWYDYPRPVSTIRWMADQGQSSYPDSMSYSINGLELEEGLIELVVEGDSLAGAENENVGKIKLYTWKGPDYIENPESDVAGVGWILAENWWPYQRPTFVTPPFAGYISGHSTFSRAAAEVLTMLTGDPFFPGGMGTFDAKKNEFLVFEDGPSVDLTLQWATYRDASDQTSLSRIWGGIHPPVDDIPGRLIGIKIGVDAFNHAEELFNDTLIISSNQEIISDVVQINPNPIQQNGLLNINLPKNIKGHILLELFDLNGRLVQNEKVNANSNLNWTINQNAGIYFIRISTEKGIITKKVTLL